MFYKIKVKTKTNNNGQITLDNHFSNMILLLKKENELKEDSEYNNRRLLTEINSTVPSTLWIHHIYDKRNDYN